MRREVVLIVIRFMLAIALVAGAGTTVLAADGGADSTAVPVGPKAVPEPCHVNFTVRGTRLSGFTLKTFDEFPDVAPSRAFQNLARAVASDGGTLQNANEKLGTLSALGALGPNVDTGHPVNALVTPIRAGARVDLSWSVGAFIVFHRGDVESRFCSWLNRIPHDASK